MRILNERDAKAIIYATALMGAGGGGSLAHGLYYLNTYAEKHEIAVKMISVDEMEDDTCWYGFSSEIQRKRHRLSG